MRKVKHVETPRTTILILKRECVQNTTSSTPVFEINGEILLPLGESHMAREIPCPALVFLVPGKARSERAPDKALFYIETMRALLHVKTL
ncbi:hypothetical protein AVEN_156510-1 [Araneus ventricosus]|uniref:Uncharacterized protein n=1 Tax=Araneus ventricosus TaxID=182803 RepID=A0A4Y2VFZ5_ARAVE|nr:hypothetical protein AVEN_156510-1 [Araneus ventricosus]